MARDGSRGGRGWIVARGEARIRVAMDLAVATSVKEGLGLCVERTRLLLC